MLVRKKSSLQSWSNGLINKLTSASADKLDPWCSFTSTKSKDSDFGALDFLCDMCVEVGEIADYDNNNETSTAAPTNSTQNNSFYQKRQKASINNPDNLIALTEEEIAEKFKERESNLKKERLPPQSFQSNMKTSELAFSQTSSSVGSSNEGQHIHPIEFPLASSSMPVTLVKVGRTFHLVPLYETDATTLACLAANSANPHQVSVSIQPGIQGLNNDDSSEYAKFGVSAQAATPKHIYKTSCDTYRVQVGKGSRRERNGKFSRNARSEYDALWLCELALIVIDCPPTIEDVIRGGNYRCILQKGFVVSPQDYVVKLLQHAEQMRQRGLLRPEESEKAIGSIRNILPPPLLTTSAFALSTPLTLPPPPIIPYQPNLPSVKEFVKKESTKSQNITSMNDMVTIGTTTTTITTTSMDSTISSPPPLPPTPILPPKKRRRSPGNNNNNNNTIISNANTIPTQSTV